MRRVLLAIGGTIAGLVALLSFKSHTGAGLPSVAASAGPSPAASAAAGSSPVPAGSSPAASAGRSPGPATPSAAARVVLTGQVVQTADGPMQVQVTLVSHRIVTVTVLQHTDNGTNSAIIDARAIPQLNQETLTAQSARIDAVSGASYTSAGYIKSLQSALDQA